jgi:HSP20 family protein
MARTDNLPVRHQRDNWMAPTQSLDIWRPDTFFDASPWQMMRRMQNEMDRMFGDLITGGGAMAPFQGAGLQQTQQMWNPSIDVSEDQKEYCIEVDLPGVSKDNVHVDIQNGQLSLRAEMRQESGDGQQGDQNRKNQQSQQDQRGQEQRQYHMRERRYGYFQRTFPLPDNVDEDQIRCDFRDGVLTCHLPKSSQPQSRARQIPIGASEQPRIEESGREKGEPSGGQQKRKAA